MTELSSARRKELRGRAHALKPVVHVGRQGLSDRVVEEIDRALADHELIKVRLAGDRDERRRDADEIARRTGAGLAGLVGAVAILYRESPEDD